MKAVETALSDDEAASEEVAVTDPEVDNVSVAMVPERVPSTEGGVAPELPATTPPAAAQTVTDQAMLGLPAEVAGIPKEVSPVVATGALLSSMIARGNFLSRLKFLMTVVLTSAS